MRSSPRRRSRANLRRPLAIDSAGLVIMNTVALRAALSALWTDERGSSPVQFAIWSLLLGLWLAFSVAIFVAWDNRADSSKAAYAVSDIFSRQEEIRNNLFVQMHDLTEDLVNNDSGDVKMRLTSIQLAPSPGDPTVFTNQVQWSCAIGGGDGDAITVHDNGSIPHAVIPPMPDGDSILLTETFVPYTAISRQVLPTSFEWENQIVTQPRRPIAFVPLCASAAAQPGVSCSVNPDFNNLQVFVNDC